MPLANRSGYLLFSLTNISFLFAGFSFSQIYSKQPGKKMTVVNSNMDRNHVVVFLYCMLQDKSQLFPVKIEHHCDPGFIYFSSNDLSGDFNQIQ